MGCGVLCAVDPHAVGAWGVGSAVGITPNLFSAFQYSFLPDISISVLLRTQQLTCNQFSAVPCVPYAPHDLPRYCSEAVETPP